MAAPSAIPTSAAPARSYLEARLASIWEEILRFESVPIDTDLFALGGTSLDAVELMNRIEAVLGVRLPIASLLAGATIESLARELEEGRLPAEADGLLVPLQAGSERPTLYFVPAVTGLPTPYIDLARAIGGDRRLMAFQEDGRNGVSPTTTIEEIALRYATAVHEDGEPSSVVVGYSLGALVALELARALAPDRPVELLVLVDPPFPHRRRPPEIDDHARFMTWSYGKRGGFGLADVARFRTEDEQLEFVLAALERRGTLPKHLGWADRDRSKRILRRQRAATMAWWDYRPEPYAGRTVAFMTEEGGAERTRTWQPLLPPDAAFVRVAGDHLTCVAMPHASGLAEELLARVAPSPVRAS